MSKNRRSSVKKTKKQLRAMVQNMPTLEKMVIRQIVRELLEAVESGLIPISDLAEKPASYRPKPKGFAPK
jgi:hypothetical protein